MQNKNYELVRNAVIKAVPSIMELKFGCEVKNARWIDKVLFVDSDDNVDLFLGDGTNRSAWMHKRLIEEIHGRKITLADVLLAIGMKKTIYLKTLGYQVRLVDDEDGIIYWDLQNDDLSKQSEHEWDYLAALLQEKS